MQQNSSTPESLIDIARAFMDAWDNRDLLALDSLFADQCQFLSSLGSEPGTKASGKAAVLQRAADMIADETEVASGSGPFWAVDNQVFAEWYYESVDDQGKRVRVRGIDRFEIENGKIVLIDSFRKAFS